MSDATLIRLAATGERMDNGTPILVASIDVATFSSPSLRLAVIDALETLARRVRDGGPPA